MSMTSPDNLAAIRELGGGLGAESLMLEIYLVFRL